MITATKREREESKNKRNIYIVLEGQACVMIDREMCLAVTRGNYYYNRSSSQRGHQRPLAGAGIMRDLSTYKDKRICGPEH